MAKPTIEEFAAEADRLAAMASDMFGADCQVVVVEKNPGELTRDQALAAAAAVMAPGFRFTCEGIMALARAMAEAEGTNWDPVEIVPAGG